MRKHTKINVDWVLTDMPHYGLADHHKGDYFLNAPDQLVQLRIGVLIRWQQLTIEGVHADAPHDGGTLIQFRLCSHHRHRILDDLLHAEEHFARHEIDIVAYVNRCRGPVIFNSGFKVLFDTTFEDLSQHDRLIDGHQQALKFTDCLGGGVERRRVIARERDHGFVSTPGILQLFVVLNDGVQGDQHCQQFPEMFEHAGQVHAGEHAPIQQFLVVHQGGQLLHEVQAH